MALPHESLTVYKDALAFSIWVETALRPALKGRAHLIDQIARASSSIVLNITEGSNRWFKRDKARFYDFAKGSAAECSSILDLIEGAKMVEVDEEWREQRAKLRGVVSKLVGLIKATVG